MPFDAAARTVLQEKLAYERFALARVLQVLREHAGIESPPTVRLNANFSAELITEHAEVLGAGSGARVLAELRPLTLLASYKLIDMIVEWVLEVNRADGLLATPVPWRFAEKRNALASLGSRIALPAPCLAAPEAWRFVRNLFHNVAEFRNTIVHRHSFDLQPGVLTITPRNQPPFPIADPELNGFAQLAVLIANALVEDRVGSRVAIQRAADHCVRLTGEPPSGAQEPLSCRVEWVDEAVFPLDLRRIEAWIRTHFPDAARGLRYDLSFFTTDDEVRNEWLIPSEALAGLESLSVSPSDLTWAQYRTRRRHSVGG